MFANGRLSRRNERRPNLGIQLTLNLWHPADCSLAQQPLVVGRVGRTSVDSDTYELYCQHIQASAGHGPSACQAKQHKWARASLPRLLNDPVRGETTPCGTDLDCSCSEGAATHFPGTSSSWAAHGAASSVAWLPSFFQGACIQRQDGTGYVEKNPKLDGCCTFPRSWFLMILLYQSPLYYESPKFPVP